jgi:carbon storage regulator
MATREKPVATGGTPGATTGEPFAMLVLSRKKNESIVVDENIVITVIEIRGDKVRLGIQAPREIPIHRSEVHAAIQAQEADRAAETSGEVPASES